MKTLVIDCNTNNVLSVARALERAGSEVRLCRSPDEVGEAFSHVVLPGIGTFVRGIENLRERGWDRFLTTEAAGRKTQILGICLGMQLLASAGHEGGVNPGLGLIPGNVIRLSPRAPTERVPHVGWNDVSFATPHPLLAGIPDETDFYFVHSYHFQPEAPESIVGSTEHCGRFAAIVQRENVMGVQFHPEKSGKPGLKLLENFLKIGPAC